ncbi:lytic polysaccharide monooxygenase auxiliary activity family 9 protein [Cellvibrio sp. NN19]|uniref:lytic polysaccharide monooxygenase auxiliary activity family 9 protein n=1 Tax=Cellvibrio chitinivorans TaxID=3102792 RepID=UPI002B4089BE|nr:lytic polysaccharide monooxygenase [Cellvibrio sp. NN19]WQA41849.1 lytic polysaccaride monooxygenase LPMO10B [Cellvibrio sp. NN19]
MKINNTQPLGTGIKSLRVFGLSTLLGTAALMSTVEVSAHGYVSSPKSRAFWCTSSQGGNTTPACIAAAAAGNASQYEPQSIGIGGANDNHQSLIPDGKLCSANMGGNNGLNLARNDWNATTVTAGPLAFVWINTAAHKTSYFRYYITKEGFNPGAAPLKWSDLEQIHQSAPAGQEAVATHIVNLPPRTGRHIVYSIWQRDAVRDAPEGFYQCIDVVYGPSNSSSSVASSAPSSSSVASSSVSNNTCAGLPTWNAATVYTQPQQVQHNSRRYSANYWTQGNDPALTAGQYSYWLDLGACSEGTTSSTSSSSSSAVVSSSSSVASSVVSSSSSSVATGNCSSPAFVNGSSYATGALVQNVGSEYKCTVGGWCSQGGAYAPGTGWAWTNAWSLVRSCN